MFLDALRYACRGLGSKADFLSATVGTVIVWWLLRYFGYTMSGDDPVLNQVTLTVASIGVSAILVFAARLSYAPYGLLKEAREKLKRLAPQEAERALGEFLAEGTSLLHSLRDEAAPAPTREGNEWLERLCTYLEKTPSLGPAYVARLNNSSGLPMGTTQIVSAEHRVLESGLKSRLARLHEFLREIRGFRG